MSKTDGIYRIAVAGAAGKMGLETVKAFSQDHEFELVAVFDRTNVGEKLRDLAGGRAPDLTIQDKVGHSMDEAEVDVLVDFTNHAAAVEHAASALKRKIAPVIGATGLTRQDIVYLTELSKENETPGMYVPNFAIGAVLMMRFAEMASKWIPDVEIIELHHDKKVDAPSGTAMLTADLISEARRGIPNKPATQVMKVEGARGGTYHDIPVHSVRLPGLVAHQEVLFGGKGELLTIRHDSLDRSSFMGGVKLCARSVWGLKGFVVGMDKILFTNP